MEDEPTPMLDTIYQIASAAEEAAEAAKIAAVALTHVLTQCGERDDDHPRSRH